MLTVASSATLGVFLQSQLTDSGYVACILNGEKTQTKIQSQAIKNPIIWSKKVYFFVVDKTAT